MCATALALAHGGWNKRGCGSGGETPRFHPGNVDFGRCHNPKDGTGAGRRVLGGAEQHTAGSPWQRSPLSPVCSATRPRGHPRSGAPGDPRGAGTHAGLGHAPPHTPRAAPQRRGSARTCSLPCFAAPAEAAPPRPVPSRPPGAAPGRAGHLKRGRAAAAPCAFPP